MAGSFWYLLTVQRVESCLSVQCEAMEHCPSTNFGCPLPIAYHHQPDVALRLAWAQNSTVQSCLNASASNFSFGIYSWAVPLVTDGQCVNKIVYPLFWGVMTFRWNFISRNPRTLDFKISMLLYPLAYSSTLNVVKIRLWHINRFLYRHNLLLSVKSLHMSNINVHQKPERLCFS